MAIGRVIVTLVTLGVVVTADEHPRLVVSSAVVVEGAVARVACRVPRSAANRRVTWGIELWGASSSDLDGDRAPLWTRDLWLMDAPCGAGPAFCEVWRVDRTSTRAVAPLTVTCRG